MSWRTVVITQRTKLDMKNGYLVMRTENEQKRVHLDEISVLMIENSAVSITGCLLAELMEHKNKTIFCNEKRNPCGELIPYYGSHDCSGKLRKQAAGLYACIQRISGEKTVYYSQPSKLSRRTGNKCTVSQYHSAKALYVLH